MKLKALLLPAIVAALALSSVHAAAQCPSSGCPSQTIGTIEFPVENGTVSGFVRVTGFALDGNLVSNVDLYVDGQDETNRITSPGGANINLPRPDVMQAFPAFAGSPGQYPGFEMSFRAVSYANGTHTVWVRITDVTGCCYWVGPRTVTIDNARNQPPFGNLDYPENLSSVSANGVLQIEGWALDDRSVDHIDVLIDGLQIRQAVVGVYRPDVAAYYPDSSQALVAGFLLYFDSTRLTNGVHTVTVKAVDDQGQIGLIGNRQIQVFNSPPNLAPFGEVEQPLLNATWFGNCFNPTGGPSGGDIVDTRYLMVVSGWALDTGNTFETGAVSHVQVLIDGVLLKDSRLSGFSAGVGGCHREFLLGNQLVDCYGYYRPDVELFYPGFANAPNAGFFFAMDVGYLITQRDFAQGAHTLEVFALDKHDQRTLIKEIPIIMECATGNLDPPPIGYVEDPVNYKFVNGVYPVIGWALDLDTVIRVRVKIDGVVQIDAITGVDHAEFGLASPDVALVYPAYPRSNFSRFRFYLDTTKLSNSEHDMGIEVVDGRGNYRELGTRRFLVDNNTTTR
jgi:N-acetylmuramoyl-L-alanine amidase